MMVSNNVCNSCMFVQGESNTFPQRLICFLLKTSRVLWSQILILWIAMYCFSGAADSIICPHLLMLQPYISYLKYDFCFTRPSVVNIYSKRNRNYKSYQWNSCKKEERREVEPRHHAEVHDRRADTVQSGSGCGASLQRLFLVRVPQSTHARFTHTCPFAFL